MMCRSLGPETVRAVQKVPLVNWLQQHDDRSLEDLILQSGYSERARLGTRAAPWNAHTPHGRSVVCAGFRAVEQALQVTYGFGAQFDCPLDVHTGVHWCGFANPMIAKRVLPSYVLG